MAMEALKSAGIKAYQGSSPKPAVQTVETAVQPQASATVKAIKTTEKAVDVVEVKPDRKAEAKPDRRAAKVMAGRWKRLTRKLPIQKQYLESMILQTV